MKKTIGIKRNFIIIIISILLSACTKKENASQQALLLELVQAEAVMYEHPDSALGVLQGMKVPASSDKLQNATWALLTVQAKYKNYKEELADSTLINIAYIQQLSFSCWLFLSDLKNHARFSLPRSAPRDLRPSASCGSRYRYTFYILRRPRARMPRLRRPSRGRRACSSARGFQ